MKGVNGCGCGSGILKYFRPPYANFFRTYCNIHDAAYDAGGTEADRKHADRYLFMHMIISVYYRNLSPAKITWFVLIAMLYYISIRILGRKYFNYKK